MDKGCDMPSQIVNLNELNLGEDSAEQDIRAGLMNYFIENNAYSSLINQRRFILVGNRGVGKSAIFKYLVSVLN